MLGKKDPKLLKGSTPVADFILEVLRHFRVGFSLSLVGLEDRVPAKVRWAPGGNDPPVGSPVKDVDGLPGSVGIRHNGLSVGRPVFEAVKHSIQAVVTAPFQEPLDVGPGRSESVRDTENKKTSEQQKTHVRMQTTALSCHINELLERLIVSKPK